MNHSGQARSAQGARKCFQVRGDNGPDWSIPNNDLETVKHGILERVFFVKDSVLKCFKRAPKPEDSPRVRGVPRRAVRMALLDRLKAITKEIKPLATKLRPLTVDEFVNSYGGSKKRIYSQAAETLETRELDRRDARVKCFTKDEYMKPGGVPRIIQPRSPRFNVMLGRHIKHVEHDVFNAIDRAFDSTGDHRTVAKGMNMVERGNAIKTMWDRFESPVAIGVDASRFDQHINTMLLSHEQSIIELFCEGGGDSLIPLRTLLKQQLVNEGRYYGKEGVIKYRVNGNRMSGDMNTSLGNVIVMCSLMYCYLFEKKLNDRVLLLNDGDDCVLIMDKRTVDAFKSEFVEFFLDFGITMEYDGVYWTLEEVEFCQSRPVYDPELGYRLVPRPHKRLYSDLFTTKDLNSKKVYGKWLGAVAGCGLAASSGMPVFQEFYSWLGRGSTPYRPVVGSIYYKYRQELSDRMSMKKREPTWETRISFFHAFGITPDEQMTLEDYYRGLPDPLWTTAESSPPRCLDPYQYLSPPEQKNNDLVYFAL